MIVRSFSALLGLLVLCGCSSMPGVSSVQSKRSGHLLIVGGGLDNDLRTIFERFIALASKPGSPRLVVITTAIRSDYDQMTEEIDKVEALRAWAPQVPVETIRRRNTTAETVAAIDRATGLFFTGGDQSRILGRYRPEGKDTAEWLAMRRLLERGGVIAGGSAGNAMMGELMLVGGSNADALAAPNLKGAPTEPEMAPGMGFLPWVITDSHFFERDRVGRLVVALELSGRRLGLGVGEDAAVEVDLASGVITGVTPSDSLLVDMGSMQRDGMARRNVRARLIRQGDRVSLPRRLSKPVLPPVARPAAPVNVVQFVDPGQNRQLAQWRVFMGASRPGSGQWDLRYEGWQLTAWPDGAAEVIFDVTPTPISR